MIDKTMKSFLSGEGGRYLRIVEAHDAATRQLLEATRKRALAGGAK